MSMEAWFPVLEQWPSLELACFVLFLSNGGIELITLYPGRTLPLRFISSSVLEFVSRACLQDLHIQHLKAGAVSLDGNSSSQLLDIHEETIIDGKCTESGGPILYVCCVCPSLPGLLVLEVKVLVHVSFPSRLQERSSSVSMTPLQQCVSWKGFLFCHYPVSLRKAKLSSQSSTVSRLTVLAELNIKKKSALWKQFKNKQLPGL